MKGMKEPRRIPSQDSGNPYMDNIYQVGLKETLRHRHIHREIHQHVAQQDLEQK